MEILKLLFVLNKEVVGLRFFLKNFFSKLLGFSLNIFLFKNICGMLVSLVAQVVKNSPAVQETWVQSLGWEVPLEIQNSCLGSPMVRGAWWTTAHGVTKGWHAWVTNTHSACPVRRVMVFSTPGLDCRGPWQVPLPHTNCQAGFKQEGSNQLANPTEYLGFTCRSVP